jgi:hypothetical protein
MAAAAGKGGSTSLDLAGAAREEGSTNAEGGRVLVVDLEQDEDDGGQGILPLLAAAWVAYCAAAACVRLWGF